MTKKIIFFGKINSNIQNTTIGISRISRSLVVVDASLGLWGAAPDFFYQGNKYNKIELLFDNGGNTSSQQKAQQVINTGGSGNE